MAEILPSTAAAYDMEESYLKTPEGLSKSYTMTGTVAAIEERTAFYEDLMNQFGSNIASVAMVKKNGRAVLTVNFTQAPIGFESTDDSVQELIGVDVIRDIKACDYFKALKNDQVSAVQKAWDERAGAVSTWNPLQNALYGHMAHGQESYCETAYEFRKSYQTTSAKQARRSASDANTVKSLPSLSPAMARLIDSLPEGEWLKKPTTVQYAGRRGWTVCESYQWAPQWSVIYGGTFTGLDVE